MATFVLHSSLLATFWRGSPIGDFGGNFPLFLGSGFPGLFWDFSPSPGSFPEISGSPYPFERPVFSWGTPGGVSFGQGVFAAPESLGNPTFFGGFYMGGANGATHPNFGSVGGLCAPICVYWEPLQDVVGHKSGFPIAGVYIKPFVRTPLLFWGRRKNLI